jgi:ubiquinone/menaquinone biosynthesis C-methylase UbiE
MLMESEQDRRRCEFFDQAAEDWEKRNYPPDVMAAAETLISALPFRKGMTILDAGCGCGILTPILRRLAGAEARLIALDASAAMLGGVAAKDPQAVALLARAENIPLPDEYVDMVVCFSAFPHFSDHPAVAREFYRVLRPGGTAHVLHLASREMINRHHDGHHAVRGDYLPEKAAMRDMFLAAGFSSVTHDEKPEQYSFAAEKSESPNE